MQVHVLKGNNAHENASEPNFMRNARVTRYSISNISKVYPMGNCLSNVLVAYNYNHQEIMTSRALMHKGWW